MSQYVVCQVCGRRCERVVRPVTERWVNTGGVDGPIGVRVLLPCGHEKDLDGTHGALVELGAIN